MSPDNGEHVSPGPPLEGFLADAKVNNLEDLGLWAVEHILWLDIPMTDISIMQILDGLHQFPHNALQLSLILDLALTEAGLVEALHDEVCAVLLEVQVESLIFDDGRMSKFLQIEEIPL